MLSVSAHMRAEVEALWIVWVWLALPECERFPAVICSPLPSHEAFPQPATFVQKPHSCLFTFVQASVDPSSLETSPPYPSHACVYHLYVCVPVLYICESIYMTGGACMYLCEVIHVQGGEQGLHMHVEAWISCQETSPIVLPPYSWRQDHPTVKP